MATLIMVSIIVVLNISLLHKNEAYSLRLSYGTEGAEIGIDGLNRRKYQAQRTAERVPKNSMKISLRNVHSLSHRILILDFTDPYIGLSS